MRRSASKSVDEWWSMMKSDEVYLCLFHHHLTTSPWSHHDLTMISPPHPSTEGFEILTVVGALVQGPQKPLRSVWHAPSPWAPLKATISWRSFVNEKFRSWSKLYPNCIQLVSSLSVVFYVSWNVLKYHVVHQPAELRTLDRIRPGPWLVLVVESHSWVQLQ